MQLISLYKFNNFHRSKILQDSQYLEKYLLFQTISERSVVSLLLGGYMKLVDIALSKSFLTKHRIRIVYVLNTYQVR